MPPASWAPLSAPGNEVAARFGLLHAARYLVELYRETFKSDLSRITGGPSWTVPMPGRYVIDTDGVVAYAGVKPDYTRRPDPKRQLRVLSAMKNPLLTDRRQR